MGGENADATYYSPTLYKATSLTTAGIQPTETFRNITSESTNNSLPYSSNIYNASERQYAGDEKLVSRLYKTIETQENEIEQLNKQYHEEQKRREQTDIEIAELKEELADTKKRSANFKKLERELKHKAELDQKERRREEADRWDRAMEDVNNLRKKLDDKNQQLAEFQLLCSNLQSSLDKGNTKTKNELEESEKRVDLLSKMLENCYTQLSRNEKQLGKERKMKQVLIKINEALQKEIKRKDKELLESKSTDITLNKSSSLKTKESEDRTNDIMKELQIEDALFYFEEVRKEYQDRPKIYREFLEVIRLYKSQNVSTPEVIARISKLFNGKPKLIVGFNRFLTKDYHVSLEDVADFQQALPQSGRKSKKDLNQHEIEANDQGQQQMAPEDHSKTAKKSEGGLTSKKPTNMTGTSQLVSKEDKASKSESKDLSFVCKSHTKNEVRHSRAYPTAFEFENIKDESDSEDFSDDESSMNADTGRTSSKALKINTSTPSIEEPGEHSIVPIPKPADKSDRSYRSAKYSDAKKTKNNKKSEGKGRLQNQMTVKDDIGGKGKKDKARRYVETKYKHKIKHKSSNSMDSGDIEEADASDKMETVARERLLDVAASNMTASSQFGGFGSFNLTPVASSPVFEGIESDSFGVNTLSTSEQSGLHIPSDRYDIIEDQDYNAIEVLAEAAGIEMIGEHVGRPRRNIVQN